MATPPVNVLITTSRMPFAVDEIHKLGEVGNVVTAADTFSAAPGSHSRMATRHVETPSPTQDPTGYVDAVLAIIEEFDVEWLLPAFEEVFYLAAHRDRLEGKAELFFPDFDTLAKVHDKVSFSQLCRDVGLPVAESITVTSDAELAEALGRWEHWFARAAFGRGGLDIITNAGPLANETPPSEIHPTPDEPWLVQEFLHGVDRCSWSVVHHGEIALHSTYQHPLAIDDRGGIVFESVDAPETLEASKKLVEALGWHGQISFDYLVTDDGVHHMVECNPRPTAGCTIATAEELDAALFAPTGETVVVPAGRKKMIKEAVLRDMILHVRRAKADAEAAKGAGGVYTQPHDHLPLLYTVLSLQHVRQYRKELGIDRSSRQDLMAAQFFDVQWDGNPIV
jgi:predicted ATP-grasp superfamily ATP-dependent carboligase